MLDRGYGWVGCSLSPFPSPSLKLVVNDKYPSCRKATRDDMGKRTSEEGTIPFAARDFEKRIKGGCVLVEVTRI